MSINAELAKGYQAAGLDPSIFDKPITAEELEKNPSFLKASRLVIAYENPELAGANDAVVGNYGIEGVRALAMIHRKAYANYLMSSYSSMSDAQKIALNYMIKAYEHSDMSKEGFVHGLGYQALNVGNYVGGKAVQWAFGKAASTAIGTKLLEKATATTIGAKVTAWFAGESAETIAGRLLESGAAKTADVAARMAARQALKHSIATSTVTGAAESAPAGLVTGTANSLIEQKNLSQTFTINGQQVTPRQGINVGEALTAGATSARDYALFGAVLNAAPGSIKLSYDSALSTSRSARSALGNAVDGVRTYWKSIIDSDSPLGFGKLLTDEGGFVRIGGVAGANKTSPSTLAGQRKSAGVHGASGSTTVMQDIRGSLSEIPRNLLYLFRNPQMIDLNAEARLIAKAVKAIYPRALKFLKSDALAWDQGFQFRMRELEKMDLDSFRYIYPLTDKIDDVIDLKLRPLFSNGNGIDDINDAREIAARLKDISQLIKNGDDPSTFSAEIKNASTRLTIIKNSVEAKTSQIDASLAPIEAEINAMISSNDTKDIKLKVQRLETIRQQLNLVRGRGIDDIANPNAVSVVNYRPLDHINDGINGINSSHALAGKNSQNYAQTLETIADNLERGLTDSSSMASKLIADADLRISGLEPTTNKPASADRVRRLKRGVDEQYVNPYQRELSVRPAKDKADNNENYFIMAIEDSLRKAFDKDGKYLGMKDQENYTSDLARNLAELYRSGDDHDAIKAIRLLRYHEADKSYGLMPGRLLQELEVQLKPDFARQGLDVSKDKNFQYWTGVITEATKRDHAPDADGPRAAQAWVIKKIKNLIYGRMYPAAPGQKDKVEHVYGQGFGQEIAAPAQSPYITRPGLKLRQEIGAFFTGRSIVPISEVPSIAEKVRNNSGPRAAQELGTAQKASRHYGLWWDAPKADKPSLIDKVTNFFSGAPTVFKAPAHWLIAPAYPGWMVSRFAFKKTAGAFALTTGLAGLATVAEGGAEIYFKDKIKDTTFGDSEGNLVVPMPHLWKQGGGWLEFDPRMQKDHLDIGPRMFKFEKDAANLLLSPTRGFAKLGAFITSPIPGVHYLFDGAAWVTDLDNHIGSPTSAYTPLNWLGDAPLPSSSPSPGGGNDGGNRYKDIFSSSSGGGTVAPPAQAAPSGQQDGNRYKDMFGDSASPTQAPDTPPPAPTTPSEGNRFKNYFPQ